MSLVDGNAIEIEIEDQKFEVGEELFEADSKLAIALEHIQILQRGLLTISREQYTDPVIIANFQHCVDTITENLDSAVERVELSTPVTISNEGMVDIVRQVIRQLIDFIKSVGKFLIKVFMDAINVQKFQNSFTKKAAQMAKEKAKKSGAGTIELELPNTVYIALNSLKHTPKAGYRYNAKSFLDRVAENEVTLEALRACIAVGTTTNLHHTKTILDAIKDNKDIATILKEPIGENAAFRKFMGHPFIGTALREKPMRYGNAQISTKFELVDVRQDLGYTGGATFPLVLDTDEIGSFCDKLTSTVEEVNKRAVGLLEDIKKSDAYRNVEKADILIRYSVDEDKLTPEAQNRNMRYFNMVFELINQLKILAFQYRNFSQRYSNILSGIVVGIEKGL